MNALHQHLASLLAEVIAVNARAVEIIARIEAGAHDSIPPIPDQPISASPPGAVKAAPPAVPSASQPKPAPQGADFPSLRKTMPAPGTVPFEKQVLDLWAEGKLSQIEIADKVGCATSSVRAYLSMARSKGDKRAAARDPKPVLIKKAGAKPTEKHKSEAVSLAPGRIAGVEVTSPGSVISLDMKNFVVACPGGDWQTSRPVALIMERMRNGETFADDVLAAIGTMGTETFRASRKRWSEELATLGITFIHTKHVGCRIEVAK